MRTEVLTYLGTQDLGSYTLSQQVPYDSSGIPLYLKNTKTVYVNLDQYSTEVFIAILGTKSIDAEITSVQIFFANDAKTLPSDYDALVSTIRSVQDLYATNGFFKRDVNVETNFDADMMTTKVEIRFYKLLT